MPPILSILKIFVTVFALDSQLFNYFSLSLFLFNSLVGPQVKEREFTFMPYERILSIPIPSGDEEMHESSEPG